MKETTVREIIQSKLIEKMKEVTRPLRENDSKKEKKRQFSRDKISELETAVIAMGWTGENITKMLNIFSVALDAPELKQGSKLPVEPLCCVVLQSAESRTHAYVLNIPHIVTIKDGCYLLHNNGSVNSWPVVNKDKPRHATD